MNGEILNMQGAADRRSNSGRRVGARLAWVAVVFAACFLLVMAAPLVQGLGLSADEGQWQSADMAAHAVVAQEVTKLIAQP